MRSTISVPQRLLASAVVFASLPGPTRKREASPYCYRLTYRNPQPREPGCVLLWDVQGGRQAYQIALERETTGTLRWHCTCADAVYRGEDAPHCCKHVRGLQGLGRSSVVENASGTVQSNGRTDNKLCPASRERQRPELPLLQASPSSGR